VGWLPFAERAAVQLISKHQIDLVLITVPPFSSVRLVTRLRRRFPSLPMVLDFRDEWLTTTLHLVSFNSNRRARAIAREAEAEAVRDATAVVAVSEGARQEIRSRYPGEREAKFQCIPNGFDSPYPPRVSSQPPAKPEKALIVYIGTVYGSTNPCTFVQAVKALPETVRGLVQIRFIGRIESPRFRDALESLGDTIEIQGFVPQKEALHALQAATYLLLISHDPLNISAKLYDYLGSGKPILGVVHAKGDVRRLIDETGAGLWADVNDVNAIKCMLAKAVDGRSRIEELYRPNSDRIAAYHRKTLADRYAALLQKIVDPSTLC
jgi:glycosyltransferase involved in cell wall biosynthesis